MFNKHKMPSAHGRNARKVHGGKFSAKGFSLVELIVIIAVMAVLIAVLAPSLLSYTERSRAQKDESSMDEVVNAVQLAMANSDCYDEAIKYSCDNNYITYTDSSGKYGQQINDGEYWAPDGSGKATTITFNPEQGSLGQTIYKLENGIVNDMTYGNGSVAQDRVMEGAQIENNQCYLKNMTALYNLVRQSIGNDVITASSTYKNSSFTIFIKFSQKDSVKVADVNGAFNGTNLLPDSQASKGSGTSTYDPNTGEAKPTITTPGKQNANFTNSDLSGGGALSGSTSSPKEEYKQDMYIENLQKDGDIAYYSTVQKAVDDLNSGNIGTNADATKENAVVFLKQKDGSTYIVLLQDHTTSATIEIKQSATLVLGGHCLSAENQYTIKVISGTLTIDGTIDGSKIKTTSTDRAKTILCLYVYDKAILNGGTYEASGVATAMGGIGTNASTNDIIVNNVVLNIDGACGHAVGAQLYVGTISNSEIFVKNDTPPYAEVTAQSKTTTYGVNIFGSDISIDNCKIETYGNNGRYLNNGNYYSGPMGISAITSKTTPISNIHVNNCEIISADIALQTQNAHVICRNSDLIATRVALAAEVQSVIRLFDSRLIGDGDDRGYNGMTSETIKSAIWVNGTAYINNCSVQSNVQYAFSLEYDGKLYMSNNTISKGDVLMTPNTKIYLGENNNLNKNDFSEPSYVIETNEVYSSLSG